MPPGSHDIIRFPENSPVDEDPVVITGVGLLASTGASREEVWQSMQTGRSGVRATDESDPVKSLGLPCAMIDWLEDGRSPLKPIRLAELAAGEALRDACIDWPRVDRARFACSIAAQLGDTCYLYDPAETREQQPTRAWWNQFFPCTPTTTIANRFGLQGPRMCYSTACASGLTCTLAGTRALLTDQADWAVCGAADTVTELFISAFNRMGVLSSGPTAESACRPFDETRSGFAMGEGAAMLVLERRSHAIARGASIYAEIAASQALCQAHHVTGLDSEAETLKQLILRLVDQAGWSYRGPQYINAHGTGTTQNDTSELMAIRAALGQKADSALISSNKAQLGHLVSAAGSVELALTALALRDGFAPPTMHLKQPESTGNLNCLPEYGSQVELDRALKLSLAFGGHLVGLALRRCPFERYQRPANPLHPQARIRKTISREPLRRAA